jgi:hypothetical protein
MIFKDLGIQTQIDATGADLYGNSVSVNFEGDLFAVGASGHSSNRGAVYLYRCDTEGNISLVQKVTASDAQSGDRFGYSVSLSNSGNILAIGAPYCTGSGGRTLHGAVYVYFWNGSSYANELKIIPNGGSNPTSGSLNNTYFGFDLNLAHNGEYLAVGNDATSEDGCLVYTYKKTADTTFSAYQVTANPRKDNYVSKFGKSVSLDESGKTLVVGAPDLAASDATSPFTLRKGGGFIFSQGEIGLPYSLKESIYFSSTSTFSKFGASVSVNWDGSIWAFGSPEYNSSQGAVAIFSIANSISKPSDISNDGYLIEPTIGTGSNIGFGTKVNFDKFAHKLMVGMYGSGDTIGKTWIFELYPELTKSANTGSIGEQIWEVNNPSPSQSNQRFGSTVALSRNGMIALAGSPAYSSNGGAYVYKSRIKTKHYTLSYNKTSQSHVTNQPTGIDLSFLNLGINFIPPLTKVAQKMKKVIAYADVIAFIFSKTGSPSGLITVEIIAGDEDGPYLDNSKAILCNSTLNVSTITSGGYSFNLPNRFIHENDQFWVVLSFDATYIASANSSNYITLGATTPAQYGLPFLQYDGTWSSANSSVLYLLSTIYFNTRSEIGRLTTTPFDIRNSIYTLRSAPYQIYGGEKLMFEKNGYLKQTLTLPTPAVPGQMTQQELVTFLNNNLSARFRCTALAATVGGQPVVVIRNDDVFTNLSNVIEAQGFIRADSAWDVSTNGTVSTDDALAFNNGNKMWLFKPDRLYQYGVTPNTVKTEWYDWFEEINKPLEQFYYSNSDKNTLQAQPFRPKIANYPMGARVDTQWTMRSFFTFVVNNFVLNPQTKKVRNSVGEEATTSLEVDRKHVNIILNYFYDVVNSQPYWSAFWYY